MRTSGLVRTIGAHGIVLLASCASPSTRTATVSTDVVRGEQLEQQQLVLRSVHRQQRRLEDVGYALLKAAIPLCGQAVGTRTGLRLANVHSFTVEYQRAARGLGFTDTLVVTRVASGSAAERAGLRAGARVRVLAGHPAPVGANALKEFVALKGTAGDSSSLALTVENAPSPFAEPADSVAVTDSGPIAVEIPVDTLCDYGLYAVKSNSLNAWADGRNVAVTSAMLRFAADDDELAAIVGHEIAHNAMRHLDARKKNARLGAILGAALDIAAATQGVNTGGGFSNSGANVGSRVFSQDFEHEADYVGLYVLALADRPIASAPSFWRRIAEESPGSIKYASTHPTSAERFVRLEQTVAEIGRKRADGAPLRPEMKDSGRRDGEPAKP